jgi:asparagine synthase (glutamine-hydrolysing)
MCGIAGILNFNKQPIDKVRLKAMTDVISHRGPDGEGIWLNENSHIGFGHRRLSIIDLSANASQPMHYLEKRYTITFNGEIYNYIEIREQLLIKGYRFISDSDTEVLLALYHEKKEDCLSELDGMFAFAIWDDKEQQLFCARDRFGEKPFHYYLNNNEFIFGSEINQIFSAGIRKEVYVPLFDQFIENGFVENDSDPTLTFYKSIKRLDNSCYLKLKLSGELSINKYWNLSPNIETFKGTLEEAKNILQSLFFDSISKRLRSDVNVGSSLSGGLDSSSIVSLISKKELHRNIQHTFTARFKDFKSDEGNYVQNLISNLKNINDHHIWLDENYAADNFNSIISFQGEPFGSTSIIAQYAVFQEAKKQNVTVLLDGQGADEYLGGYPSYYFSYLNQLYFKNYCQYELELSKIEKNYGARIRSKYEFKKNKFQLLSYFKAKFISNKVNKDNNLKLALHQDVYINGLKSLLRYADRNSMANSVEVRLPFLQHKIVEFVFTLPDNFLLNGGWTKYILRKSMEEYLPKEICWRKDKVGYASPQENWMKNKFFLDKQKVALNWFMKNKDIFCSLQKNNSIDNFRILIAYEYINS